MSKGDRNRSRSARERIAAQQARAQRAERRRGLLIAGGSVGVVLVVVLIFVFIAISRKPAAQAGTGDLPASVLHEITSVPASTLVTIGTGSVLLFDPQPIKTISDQPLVASGKPEMLYVGAEFCPFCAAMRWSMAVALSRFGTFGPLRGIHSSSTDYAPNTATLTFYQTRYSSKYLTFTPVENQTVSRAPLQPMTKQQQAIFLKYTNGYPFIDFGGKYVIAAPLYDPKLLAGLNWSQVASALHNPEGQIAQGAIGTSNYITAAICKMTANHPASVCAAAPIPAMESKL